MTDANGYTQLYCVSGCTCIPVSAALPSDDYSMYFGDRLSIHGLFAFFNDHSST